MTVEVAVAESSTTADASLASKILKQVEFYFGDANLPRDKFLLAKMQEDADGWVPIQTIASFSRMAQLSQDVAVVAESLLGSAANGGNLEVSEDRTMVRRCTPLPQHVDTLATSVYVKGLPVTASLDELLAFFGQHSAKVLAVRVRRHPKTKEPKGSVFVELADAEEAKRLASMANLEYAGNPLSICLKSEYFNRKNNERLAASGKRGPSAKETDLQALAKDYVRGCLAVLEPASQEGQLDQTQPFPHESIKAAVSAEQFTIAFCELNQTDKSVWMRFKEPVAEAFVAKYSSEGFTIPDTSISYSTVRLASEAEEATYYAKLASLLDERYRREASSKRGRRGNNDRRGTKRTSEPNKEESTTECKKAKAEDHVVEEPKKEETVVPKDEEQSQ